MFLHLVVSSYILERVPVILFFHCHHVTFSISSFVLRIYAETYFGLVDSEKYKVYENCQLFLLCIKSQVTCKNENITLQVKSLTNMFALTEVSKHKWRNYCIWIINRIKYQTNSWLDYGLLLTHVVVALRMCELRLLRTLWAAKRIEYMK